MNLSIIIPVYNGERYIENCINSIINNCNENIEIIVINDGSTDSTYDILQKISKENKSLKIFNNNNKGVSYSRNYGIKKATGKYILFLDADDYLSDAWIKIMSVLENDYFDYLLIGNVDFPKKLDKQENLLYTIGLKEIGYYFSTPWSKIYRRDFLIKNNIFFSEKIFNGEDELFNIMTILNANVVKTQKMSIYNYRVSRESLTKRFDEKIFESDLNFKNELKDLLVLFKLKKNIMNDILDFIEYNSIKMLINRISYINKYSLAKIEYHKIKPYKSKYCLGTFNKTIRFFMNHKMYFIVYCIHRSKNVVRTLKKEKIIKI